MNINQAPARANETKKNCHRLSYTESKKTFRFINDTYFVTTLWSPRSGQTSTFRSGLLLAGFIVWTATWAAHTDWFLYSAPTLTHCAPPLIICAWFMTWISKSILITVLLSHEARVTLPKSNMAMLYKLSLADDVSVFVLLVDVRHKLPKVYVASVIRKIAVLLNGSLIFTFRGVDSATAIVKLNWTLRPTNCHSVDLWSANLNSEAWKYIS